METVHQFPHAVRTIENLWIPLPDGTRLAARAWIPPDADDHPVPAIVEYIPYRKREFTRLRDDVMHAWFAGHGYACLRVDLRGSGESDGLLTDEYLPRELDDGEAILAWIAAQPWCNGVTGMIGISWGGFNGLQLAARQPPSLRAIITACSTDDRYTDDIHYMGGCLLADNLSWASTMYSHTALPPDPAIVGERWREMWHARMEGSGFWLEQWLRHQHRDDYWRHGSINENYDRVQIPVMAISGWADGYSNAVFRLLENLRGPRMGLIGPWGHKYPHQGRPGPTMDFLTEAVRWWDRWLKDEASGIDAEPMLRAWMQDSAPPEPNLRTRPGRWVGETSWPSPRVDRVSHPLLRGRVGGPGAPEGSGQLQIQSPLSVGLFAGRWASFTATPDLPHDQREEDGGSLVFDSEPLTSPVEILGAPVVTLRLAVDQPVAMVALRLSDIAEDDKATRVSYGLLNLTHRDSNEFPEPLEPGKRYRVSIPLKHIAQQFAAGHAIRLALSTSYWPLAWPAPNPVRLTILPGRCRLVLPVRAPRPAEEATLPAFGGPEGASPMAKTLLQPTQESWQVIRDLANDRTTLEVINDEGRYRIDDIDLEISARVTERYQYSYGSYDSLSGWTEWQRSFKRGDWEVRTLTRTLMTSDADNFRLRATLDAWEGDTRIFARTWDETIPRDLV